MPVVETWQNLIRDPRFTNSTSWSVQGAAFNAVDGVLDVTMTSASTTNFVTPQQSWFTSVTPGEPVSGSYLVSNVSGTTASVRVSIWSGTVYDFGPLVSIAPGETKLVAHTATTPAGASMMQPRLHGAIAVGTRLRVSEPITLKSAALVDFFYGGMAGRASLDGAGWDTFAWDGTPNASTSTMTRNRRLTPFSDMAPVPRVALDIPTSIFPPGSVTVSFTREAEGRTMDVRGGQRLPASAPAILIDPEPAFGIRSTYTVIGHNAAGEPVGSFPAGSVVVECDRVVVQQPLDPRLAVEVAKLAGTGEELARETPGQPAYPQGSVLPGVISLGPRRGLSGVALELMVNTRDEADDLQATLGTYETPQLPIWLIRTPPGWRMPAVFFCHVPRLVERSSLLGMGLDQVLFSAVVTEVKPPAAGIVAAGLTYSDVRALYATYSAVKAQYATYSDVKRDTSLIGAGSA